MSKLYGLIGKKLSHSFSKRYFSEKFDNEGLTGHRYELFELEKIDNIIPLIQDHPNLAGLNVTIPYKSDVLLYISRMDDAASDIGAVNTIKINGEDLLGFNTDAYGFERSLFENVKREEINKALILGSGGASKAVKYVLLKNEISFVTVSRKPSESMISYQQLFEDSTMVKDYQLIVNTTPLGMYPNLETKPDFPYGRLSKNHILFDLVYNPEQTSFLREGANQQARLINGLKMLHYQAERSWEIWNDPKI